ncbi:unnamed protein product [Gadus morhua 'NCC']
MRYLVISQAFVPECLNVFISIVFTLRPASQHIPDLQSYIVQRWPCGTPRPPHHSASIMEQGGRRSTLPRWGVAPSEQSFTPTLIPALTSIAHDIPRYAEAASARSRWSFISRPDPSASLISIPQPGKRQQLSHRRQVFGSASSIDLRPL